MEKLLETELLKNLEKIHINKKNGKQIISLLQKKTKDAEEYKANLYDISSLLSEGYNIELILSDLKKGCVNWETQQFSFLREKRDEHDSMIENPPIIKMTGMKCPNCKGTKTFNFSRQLRSGDEGMTNFLHCLDCDKKFTI